MINIWLERKFEENFLCLLLLFLPASFVVGYCIF